MLLHSPYCVIRSDVSDGEFLETIKRNSAESLFPHASRHDNTSTPLANDNGHQPIRGNDERDADELLGRRRHETTSPVTSFFQTAKSIKVWRLDGIHRFARILHHHSFPPFFYETNKIVDD